MKEKIKSLLLVFLVLTSVHLTYTLWVSFPQNDLLFSSKKSTNLKVDIFRIIRPEYTFIGLKNEVYLVSEGDLSLSLWEKTANFIVSQKEEKINVIEENNFEKIQEGNFIRFLMGKGVKGDLLRDIFGNKDNWYRKINGDANIEEITVNIDRNQIILIDKDNKKIYSLIYSDMKDLKNVIENLPKKDSLTVYESVYKKGDISFTKNVYIPSTSLSVKRIYNKEIDLESDRHFVERFFTNISVVRKVTENNGCIVYTDGLKSLRIYQNDYIEFYDTLSESSPSDKVLALKKAASFLENIGVKSENIYLTRLKEYKNEYIFYFNYIFDYPLRILPKASEDFPIEVTIFDGSVKYARVLYLDLASNGNYVFSQGELQQYLVKGLEDLKGQQFFSDLKIGYFFSDGQFIPVWIVENDKQVLFINLINGNLIDNGV
ncbi:MAG TPA: hypothetical protein GXX15_01450 [Clostridia bacterium]|nr:hypothetical protein [Clostridia bacterium]